MVAKVQAQLHHLLFEDEFISIVIVFKMTLFPSGRGESQVPHTLDV